MENSHGNTVKKIVRALQSAVVLWGAPLLASAQQGGGPLGVGVIQSYDAPARDLPGTVLTIINYILVLVGVLALAYLVYGGFLYITSRGDDTQIEAAKSAITNAIIGVVVIGIAAAIVNFVVGAILSGA